MRISRHRIPMWKYMSIKILLTAVVWARLGWGTHGRRIPLKLPNSALLIPSTKHSVATSCRDVQNYEITHSTTREVTGVIPCPPGFTCATDEEGWAVCLAKWNETFPLSNQRQLIPLHVEEIDQAFDQATDYFFQMLFAGTVCSAIIPGSLPDIGFSIRTAEGNQESLSFSLSDAKSYDIILTDKLTPQQMHFFSLKTPSPASNYRLCFHSDQETSFEFQFGLDLAVVELAHLGPRNVFFDDQGKARPLRCSANNPHRYQVYFPFSPSRLLLWREFYCPFQFTCIESFQVGYATPYAGHFVHDKPTCFSSIRGFHASAPVKTGVIRYPLISFSPVHGSDPDDGLSCLLFRIDGSPQHSRVRVTVRTFKWAIPIQSTPPHLWLNIYTQPDRNVPPELLHQLKIENPAFSSPGFIKNRLSVEVLEVFPGDFIIVFRSPWIADNLHFCIVGEDIGEQEAQYEITMQYDHDHDGAVCLVQ